MVTTATATAPSLHAANEYSYLPEEFQKVLADADEGDSIIWVPIAKTGQLAPINVTKCSGNTYAEALWLGMKALANRGTTKITLQSCGSEEELAKQRMEAAAKQHAKIMDGSIRYHTGAKPSKVPANIMAEAKKIARADLEDQMRAAGLHIGHYPARTLTAATLQHLKQRPEIMKLAEENVKRRQELPKVAFDLSTLIPDAAKIEASTTRKAKAKAKEADIVARTLPTRQRPAPAMHAPH